MVFVEGAWALLQQAGTPFQIEAFFFLLCLAGIVFLVIFILVGIWVYRDAESRGMEGTLWALGVVLGGLLGAVIVGVIILIIYLVVRKDRPVGGYYAPYGPYPPPGAYPPPGGYPPPAGPTPPQTPPAAPPATPSQPEGGAAASLTCKQCGSAIPAGGTFCPSCGAKV